MRLYRKNSKGYLLLELLIGGVLLAIIGVKLSQSFSLEMELAKLNQQTLLVVNFTENYFNDYESKHFLSVKEETLFPTEKGSIAGSSIVWEGKASFYKENPSLIKMELLFSQLKGERELYFSKLVHRKKTALETELEEEN